MTKKKIKWTWQTVAGLVLLVIALFAPPFIKSEYVIHLFVTIAFYVGLATSLNLIIGYTGVFSLGHAAFYGIGAYCTGILVGKLGLPIITGFIAAAIVAALFGIIIGYPSLNLRGDYLAIVTLGFGQIIRLIELNEMWLTNGAMGIVGIRKPTFFGQPFKKIHFYYLALLIALITIYVVWRLIRSRVGRALISIREDDLAAMSIGINVRNYKILAFAISTALAGVMGCVYAHYITFISPDQYTLQISINIFCMCIVGGLGTIMGPIFGAILLALLPEVMRTFDTYRIIIVGLVMVLCMIFRPQGICGSYQVGGTSIWTSLGKKITAMKRKQAAAKEVSE